MINLAIHFVLIIGHFCNSIQILLYTVFYMSKIVLVLY
jgi:hypothetical protein